MADEGIKKYKEYIYKDGQFRKVTTGGKTVKVVDELPLIGEEGILYVLDGSKLTLPNYHRDVQIDRINLKVDGLIQGLDYLPKTEETKSDETDKNGVLGFYRNNDEVFDAKPLDEQVDFIRTKKASKYFLEITSTEIDDAFEDAIVAGLAVLRFDYPTLQKLDTKNLNYKGPGRRGYCRNFQGKYADWLTNCLIFITPEDIRLTDHGEKYIYKKISILDLFNKSYKLAIAHIDDPFFEDGKHKVKAVTNLFTDKFIDMPSAHQQLLSTLLDKSSDKPAAAENYNYRAYINTGNTFGATLFPKKGLVPANFSKFFTSRWAVDAQLHSTTDYSKYAGQIRAVFPIKLDFDIVQNDGHKVGILDSNNKVVELNDAETKFGLRTLFSRNKHADRCWYDTWDTDEEEQMVHKYMNSDKTKMYTFYNFFCPTEQRSIAVSLVPQFAILTENWQTTDDSAWEKTYTRSLNGITLKIPAIHLYYNEDTYDEAELFATAVIKLTNRIK